MTRAQLLLELQEVVVRGKASNTLTPVISALNQIGKFLEDQGGDLPPCGTVEVHFLEPEDPPADGPQDPAAGGPKKRRRRKPKPVQL